jgi:hypothetical protein
MSLLVLVVGDRQVEGAENLDKLLVAGGVERRAQVRHSVEHRHNLVGGGCPAGRLALRASSASATADLRVLNSTIRSLAATTTGCVGRRAP